jgi:hypothetical protein
MGQKVRVAEKLQHLDQTNTDILKQMIELEKLREAVRLAQAGKPYRQSGKLRRHRQMLFPTSAASFDFDGRLFRMAK